MQQVMSPTATVHLKTDTSNYLKMDALPQASFKNPCLDSGDTYFEWAEQMCFVLMHKGRKVWQAATGEYTHPTVEPGIRVQDANATVLDAWEEANDMALALIGSCLSPSLLYIVRDKDSVHDTWKALKTEFQEYLIQHIEHLEDAFSKLRQGKGAGSYNKFVSNIQTIADKLAAVGVHITALRKTKQLIKGVCKDVLPWTAALQIELDRPIMDTAQIEADVKPDTGIWELCYVLQMQVCQYRALHLQRRDRWRR